MLEVPLRSHRTELPPRPQLAARKLATSGDTDQKPDCEPCNVQFSDSQMYVSPVAPTGSYRMARVIKGIEMFLLLDTAVAVALLREEASWSQVIAKEPQDLMRWSTVTLVSVGGTPLIIHDYACVVLELKHK